MNADTCETSSVDLLPTHLGRMHTLPVVMRVLLGYMYMSGRQVARKNSSVWRSSSGRIGCSKSSSGLALSEDPGT